MLGDRQGPGLLGVTQAAALFLHGWRVPAGDPDEAEGSIRVTGVNNVYAEGWGDKHAACAQISLTMPIVLREAYRLDEFLRLGAEWDFGGETVEETINLRAE